MIDSDFQLANCGRKADCLWAVLVIANCYFECLLVFHCGSKLRLPRSGVVSLQHLRLAEGDRSVVQRTIAVPENHVESGEVCHCLILSIVLMLVMSLPFCCRRAGEIGSSW